MFWTNSLITLLHINYICLQMHVYIMSCTYIKNSHTCTCHVRIPPLSQAVSCHYWTQEWADPIEAYSPSREISLTALPLDLKTAGGREEIIEPYSVCLGRAC